MIKSSIFTEKELEVISKRISHKRLNQVDSNYLYKFIRPKIREIASIDAGLLLNKMEYNQKIKSIEEKIKKTILASLDAQAVILYGSAIQTNYKEYNDIDIIVVTKKDIVPIKEKYRKILKIKKLLEKYSIKADIEIYSESSFQKTYPSSPSLIYQLKEHKIIYGKINLPKKINLHNIHLQMKLDWSYLDDKPQGVDIYKALRNTVLVWLLLNKIVDNQKLNESLNDELGRNLIERLKSNKESKLDRKIALIFLKELKEKTRKELGKVSWERINL
jgi:predicted nucleotidyltransferase